MEEKKLTDEELKKAFFILKHGSAEGLSEYVKAVLAIENEYNRQKAEIERLKNREKIADEDLNNVSNEWADCREKNAELQKQVDELKEELKDLDWYKMWHKKFQKEIEDLTAELETYRPTKLSGHGQCKCSNCGDVSWTDWFSHYKGKTLCDECLKEIMETEEQQTVKDTAKKILQSVDKESNGQTVSVTNVLRKCYGVEVE